MCMAQRIWINTGNGRTILLMDLYGRQGLTRVGLRIAMAAGLGKTTMVGPGLAPIPGAGRRITTGAGSLARVVAGAGIPDQFMPVITGHRRTSDSSGTADSEGSDLDSEDSVGGRWLRMKGSIPGGAGDSTAASAKAGFADRLELIKNQTR